jgi:hypothetical protein
MPGRQPVACTMSKVQNPDGWLRKKALTYRKTKNVGNHGQS